MGIFSVNSTNVSVAACKLSNTKLSYGGNPKIFSTLLLIQHLRVKHASEFKVYTEASHAKATATKNMSQSEASSTCTIAATSRSQLLVAESWQRVELCDIKSCEAKWIHQAIGRMIGRSIFLPVPTMTQHYSVEWVSSCLTTHKHKNCCLVSFLSYTILEVCSSALIKILWKPRLIANITLCTVCVMCNVSVMPRMHKRRQGSRHLRMTHFDKLYDWYSPEHCHSARRVRCSKFYEQHSAAHRRIRRGGWGGSDPPEIWSGGSASLLSTLRILWWNNSCICIVWWIQLKIWMCGAVWHGLEAISDNERHWRPLTFQQLTVAVSTVNCYQEQFKLMRRAGYRGCSRGRQADVAICCSLLL